VDCHFVFSDEDNHSSGVHGVILSGWLRLSTSIVKNLHSPIGSSGTLANTLRASQIGPILNITLGVFDNVVQVETDFHAGHDGPDFEANITSIWIERLKMVVPQPGNFSDKGF
jgi:hypothetical protein